MQHIYKWNFYFVLRSVRYMLYMCKIYEFTLVQLSNIREYALHVPFKTLERDAD